MDDKYNEAIDLYMAGKYREAIDSMAQSKTVAPDVYQQFVKQCRAIDPTQAAQATKPTPRPSAVAVKTPKVGIINIAVGIIFILIGALYDGDSAIMEAIIIPIASTTTVIYGITHLATQYISSSALDRKKLAVRRIMAGLIMCSVGVGIKILLLTIYLSDFLFSSYYADSFIPICIDWLNIGLPVVGLLLIWLNIKYVK